MKNPLCLALAIFFVGLAAQSQSVPNISAARSPAEGIRKPNRTIPSENTRSNVIIAYNPNGQFLATRCTGGVIHIYDTRLDVRLAALIQTFVEHQPIVVIGFYDTNTLVSLSQNQTAKLWDVTSGKMLHSAKLNFGKQLIPAIAPGRAPLLAGGTLRQIRLWDYQTGELLHSFEANDSNVAALAFTPDGKLLVIGTTKGVVRVMDIAAWKVIRSIDLDTPVRSIAASTNHIAVGYAGGAVALLNFDDQSDIPEVNEQSGAILSLAFSPDGKQFASASADGTVKVWETETLKLLCSLGGYVGEPFSVAFSPHGEALASGDSAGDVNFWTIPLPDRSKPFKGPVAPSVKKGMEN